MLCVINLEAHVKSFQGVIGTSLRVGDVTNQEAIKPAQTKLSLVCFVSSQVLCVKLSVLFGVVCHYFNTKRTDMVSKQWQAFRMCVLPCPRYLNGRGYTQFVLPVWERSMHGHRSRGLWALRCASLADTPIPPGVLSQKGCSGSHSPGSSASYQGWEARAAVSSTPIEAQTRQLSASPQSHGAFSGVAEECNGFLLQCSLYIENQPHLYTTERSKVSFLISLLSSKALQWAETIWAQADNITQSFDNFVSHFREVFGRPHSDPTASDKLYHLRQGSQPIKEYALRFRTLAAASGWNERSLITTYSQGLEPRLRFQMASYGDNFGLETMIQHSIRCSSRMQSCFDEQTSWNRCTPSYRHPEAPFPPEPEPMQTEAMRLAPAEQQRRLSKGLWLYCGGGGHVISSCPTRPPRLLVSSIQPVPQNMSPLTLVVTLITPHITLPVHALLDSGSARSFISGSLCRQLKIPTAVNPKTYQIQCITGKSLSRHKVRYLAGPITLRVGHLHEENIQLLVLEEANTDIILDRPWFAVHEPQIAWRKGDVLKWGNQCFPDCFPSLPRPSPPAKPILFLNATSIESPVDQQSVDIPEYYSHFRDVFCPKKATQLPPHRPWDCAIDLLPGESVPKGKIYPVTPRAKGHGGVYKRGSPTGLHRPFYLPCCFKFLFCGQEGRRLADLYRLPVTE